MKSKRDCQPIYLSPLVLKAGHLLVSDSAICKGFLGKIHEHALGGIPLGLRLVTERKIACTLWIDIQLY